MQDVRRTSFSHLPWLLPASWTIGEAALGRLGAYWAMVKGLQTGLLVVTGLAGLMSLGTPLGPERSPVALVGSLALAIGGSTILNMLLDRHIDARMERTVGRPLPDGRVKAGEALVVGLCLAAVGTGWAFALDPAYGLVVLAGLFFDVAVYTLWLKRRTPWSIVWGGIAGAMPVLGGRVLALGRVNPIGLLLALAVLLWIPTHCMTFSLKHAADYRRAGVPVFPNTHGERFTHRLVGASTGAAVLLMLLATWEIGLRGIALAAAAGMGALLIAIALAGAIQPSAQLDSRLFKLASLYMLMSMLLVMVH